MHATVKLDFPTLGCVACIHTINHELQQTSQQEVVQVSLSLHPLGAKGGQAVMQLVARSEEQVQELR